MAKCWGEKYLFSEKPEPPWSYNRTEEAVGGPVERSWACAGLLKASMAISKRAKNDVRIIEVQADRL